MASKNGKELSSGITESDNLDIWELRRLKFRVLILGRANGGKTTILERLTGSSIEEAEVWRDGERINKKFVKGRRDRGQHNIEEEIRFPSQPGFVFHDSCGFESGGRDEYLTARKFVEDRSATVANVRKQLHAIWICLPLAAIYNRELFDTEKEVFSWARQGTPLIVIFTKHDGIVTSLQSRILGERQTEDETDETLEIKEEEAEVTAKEYVAAYIQACEANLKQLNLANDAIDFVTTSAMDRPSPETFQACEDLINKTEGALKGPRIKTLLAVVWGHNLLKKGFQCFYWLLQGK